MSDKLNYIKALVARTAGAVDTPPDNPAPTGDSNIEPPIPGVAMQGGTESEERTVDQADAVGRDATALDALNSHIASGARGTYAKAPTAAEIQAGLKARATRATLKPDTAGAAAKARTRQRSQAQKAVRKFKGREAKPKSRIQTNKDLKTEMLSSY